MRYFIIVVSLLIILSGCTQINVRKIDSKKYAIKHVCIKENQKVNINDFINVLEEKFFEYGITSEVYEERTAPTSCKYIVKYTAKQSWDISHYIGYAEINIYDDRRKIGGATYKQSGGSASLSLNKWGTTLEKIGPVLDNLLSKFSGQLPLRRNQQQVLQQEKKEKSTNQLISEKLRELKKLYKNKLINKADYDDKKKEILKEM